MFEFLIILYVFVEVSVEAKALTIIASIGTEGM
jgi:hypothetical protein